MPRNQPYNVGKWHELPNYQCKACGFSTLDEPEILYHCNTAHRLATRPSSVLVANSEGREVQPLEVPDEE